MRNKIVVSRMSLPPLTLSCFSDFHENLRERCLAVTEICIVILCLILYRIRQVGRKGNANFANEDKGENAGCGQHVKVQSTQSYCECWLPGEWQQLQ